MEWVTTPDVQREIWRRLREFANPEFAVDAISAIHGAPADNHIASGYKKQAQQIRACVLQASEYFAAARSTSLVTSPNHIYYGLVSLASAVMLLLGDGKKSFDYLRKGDSNKHHGLEFSQSSSVADAKRGLGLLEHSRVRVRRMGTFETGTKYCLFAPL